MIYDLIKEFADVLDAMPEGHPRRRILKLLDEAIRRDIHFIDRHPTTLFQCLWNICWWYDCREAAQHYEEPEGGWSAEGPPWKRLGPKLCDLVKKWASESRLPLVHCGALEKGDSGGGEMEGDQQSRPWFRTHRPPVLPLGSAQHAQLTGHTNYVTSVAFSPDNRRIVSGSYDDKTVRVWDAASGVQIAQLEGHKDRIICVAFSPDGRRIASASDSPADTTVRNWDAESGECLGIVQGISDVRAIIPGAESYAYRLISRTLETVVEVAAIGKPIAWFPIAWFPIPLSEITTHRSGRKWAAKYANHVYILELMGDVASDTVPT